MSRKKHRRRHRKPPRIRRLTAPGTTPGTLTVPLDAAAPTIHVMQYTAGQLNEKIVHRVEHVRQFLDETSVTWVNVDGLGDAQSLHELGELFGLHGLAVEDVVNLHQRAKVDEYGDHLFIVLRVVRLNEHVDSDQLSIFLGSHFVLTLQSKPSDCLEPVRERLRQTRGRIRELKADYLAYALIDAVVDAYFPVVDDCGERMERMEQQLSSGQLPHFIDALHDVRTDLMTLRRAIRPLRDALILLMPDPHSLITAETQFHIRDCYDHTIQLMDLLDAYREMCSDLRDYYMSTVNHRMNEIMKVLTIIATIFIPLSFIASVYGMNFNTRLPGNMPELNWPYGYVCVLLLMAVIGLGLFWFIWRRGWLREGSAVIENSNNHRRG